MKTKKPLPALLSVFLLVFISFMTSCSQRQIRSDTASDRKSSDRKLSDSKSSDRKLSDSNAEKVNYSKDIKLKPAPVVPRLQNSEPARSGQTVSVPWENDPSFKAVLSANNCTLLMAAYKTVLKDPLPGEEENVRLAARYISGTILKPGEMFSQNMKAGPYTQDRGYQKGPTYIGTQLTSTIGGGVCKIASTLYNVTVLSNLQVAERHFHSMPVPYVPYGQDATVSYGVKDFKFCNNTPYPLLIWAQGIENRLYIAFYGNQKPPRVEWHHEMQKIFPASKIYRTNPGLPRGTERMVLEGMDGGIVNSWVTIQNPDGTSGIKLFGKSCYNPMAYIIEIGGLEAAKE